MGAIQQSINQLLTTSAVALGVGVKEAERSEEIRHSTQDIALKTAKQQLSQLELPKKPLTEKGKELVETKAYLDKAIGTAENINEVNRAVALRKHPGHGLLDAYSREFAERQGARQAMKTASIADKFVNEATQQLKNKEKFFRLFLRDDEKKFAGSTKYMSEKDARAKIGNEKVDAMIKAGKFKEML